MKVDSGWSRRGTSELNEAERPAKGIRRAIQAEETASAKALRQEQW